jgi:hypothetical protein
VCTHFGQHWPVGETMPLIARSGVGWIRDELGWGALEPAPGKYQIPLTTRVWIDAARRAGLKIVLILAYGNRAYPDHYDTAAYAKAAGWLARELPGVDAIEILNEPNNFGFRTTYGGAWNGKEPNNSVSPYVRKYVEILNAAAKEIKLANPQMKVIGLGAPPPASFRMIALGLAPEVDGLTDHPYSNANQVPELIPYGATPVMLMRDGIATADAQGTFTSQVSMFRAQANKFGSTEKLWHTEWGYSTVEAKPEKRQRALSQDTQAVYIVRRILQSYGIGVEHTFIYDFKDDGADPYSDYENYGLVKSDRSPKESFFAVQRVTRLLAGMPAAPSDQSASLESAQTSQKDGPGPQCYTFASPNEELRAVAFWIAKPWEPGEGMSEAVVNLPLAKDPAHLVLYDLLTGKETLVTWKRSGSDGRISIAVPLSATPQLLMVR